MPTVTVIQRIVPHYRVPFFTLLNERLLSRGINFNLVYGQEYPGTVPVSVPIEAPWATQIQNRYFSVSGETSVWQPAWRHARNSDLIIIEQASAYLLNYWLLMNRKIRALKIAYWGQGVNVRARNPKSLPERVKASLLTKVDWWFAYSRDTKRIVERGGFPTDRITVVENAVDNNVFRRALESVTEDDVTRLKDDLGIDSGPVGLYCGAFIPPKRIDFLLEVCHQLKSKLPGFHALLIGSGPEEEKGRRVASEHPWIHYVGAKFSGERAVYFRSSDVLLQPGTIGLICVDSFVAEVPLFTTNLASHGPEIAFVQHGQNGWITDNNLTAYVEDVVAYLQSKDRQTILKTGCQTSAKLYTLDSMVDRFSGGIAQCLSA